MASNTTAPTSRSRQTWRLSLPLSGRRSLSTLHRLSPFPPTRRSIIASTSRALATSLNVLAISRSLRPSSTLPAHPSCTTASATSSTPTNSSPCSTCRIRRKSTATPKPSPTTLSAPPTVPAMACWQCAWDQLAFSAKATRTLSGRWSRTPRPGRTDSRSVRAKISLTGPMWATSPARISWPPKPSCSGLPPFPAQPCHASTAKLSSSRTATRCPSGTSCAQSATQPVFASTGRMSGLFPNMSDLLSRCLSSGLSGRRRSGSKHRLWPEAASDIAAWQGPIGLIRQGRDSDTTRRWIWMRVLDEGSMGGWRRKRRSLSSFLRAWRRVVPSLSFIGCTRLVSLQLRWRTRSMKSKQFPRKRRGIRELLTSFKSSYVFPAPSLGSCISDFEFQAVQIVCSLFILSNIKSIIEVSNILNSSSAPQSTRSAK